MAIRFRKSFSIAPGIKLNIGKKSASVRIGVKGLGFTTGTAGNTVTAGIPGTGLSASRHFLASSGGTVPDTDLKPESIQAPARHPWSVLILVYAIAGLTWWAVLHQ
ncbi:Protein of unknown function [Bradyrhizobium sp. NFR13]|uniref:DUF4236 domain-containing protein n=1 Tax=Bradyrhizobium sp. NFR13 TaxID=1566285 RepID=UPI0008F2D3E1|nr:DUF4236 domain-containing protein [Bradyrhizobium sp. NFR13]SFL93688.1 Protein of unknown function [Bradyrhizobium sp. NFR13]